MQSEQRGSTVIGSDRLPTGQEALAAGGGFAGRRAMLAFKLTATALALVLLGRFVDPAALVTRVRAVDPHVFAAAVLLMALQIPLVALRWRVIVSAMNRSSGPQPSVAAFLRITSVALFFGQILPFVAGDGVRVVMLREVGSSLRIALKSTLLDRATAALALFALALPAALASPVLSAVRTVLWPAIALIVFGLAAAAAAILAGPALHRFGRRWRAVCAVTETLLDLRSILASWVHGPVVVVACFIVHGLSVFVFWLLAHGQGLPFGIVDAVAVVPLVLLVSMAPIAVGGWGLREGFVVLLLGASGIGHEDALLLSLSFGTAVLLASLPGLALLALSALPARAARRGRSGKVTC